LCTLQLGIGVVQETQSSYRWSNALQGKLSINSVCQYRQGQQSLPTANTGLYWIHIPLAQ
jgi:hypothetical protein